MEQMEAQATHVGTRVIYDLITEVDFSRRPFRAGRFRRCLHRQAVIIATGAQARWLGLESERPLQGRGVSACATCDGFFFRGKRVAVVGGGNTAVEEALYLTHHADRVTLIHRREPAGGENPAGPTVREPEDRVVWDSAVEEIAGAGTPAAVDGVRLRNMRDRPIAR